MNIGNRRDGKRGAALILEIIIYLVIVSLIAVAVTSGVRAVRDLVFTSHARGDAQMLQSWIEGKYAQDGKYPVTNGGINSAWNSGEVPNLTVANGVMNTAAFNTADGSGSGYCIQVISQAISDPGKRKFWIMSSNPGKVMQSNTGSNGGSYDPPATGSTLYQCPNWSF